MSNDKKDSDSKDFWIEKGINVATVLTTGMAPKALITTALSAIGPVGWLALGGVALVGVIIASASDDDQAN